MLYLSWRYSAWFLLLASFIRMETKGRKKALLIAILYRECDESTRLNETVTEVEQLRDLLIECYDYAPQDIVVMTDKEGSLPEMEPTKKNIMRELRLLLDGARDHDHFLFHFSGHSDQLPSRSDTEEDQHDETIVCADDSEIKDNTLRQMLVDRLPKGASLTAIFDSCHSGTLLDLEHDECNKVWVPWMNKGQRRSGTMRNRKVRANALCQTAHPEKARSFNLGIDGFDEDTRSVPPRSFRTFASFGFAVSFPEGRFKRILAPILPPTWLPEIPTCFSPIAARKRSCDGTCKRSASREHPSVISISAAQDEQLNWSGRGYSMTLTLVRILRKNRRITHSELLTKLNYSLHKHTMGLHKSARRQRRKIKEGKKNRDSGILLEMNNFQEPQLSSITPLNMNEIFYL